MHGEEDVHVVAVERSVSLSSSSSTTSDDDDVDVEEGTAPR